MTIDSTAESIVAFDMEGSGATSDTTTLTPRSPRTGLGKPRASRTGLPYPKPSKPAKSTASKGEMVLKKLAGPKGVTVQTLMEVTGWQAHSVRGFCRER